MSVRQSEEVTFDKSGESSEAISSLPPRQSNTSQYSQSLGATIRNRVMASPHAHLVHAFILRLNPVRPCPFNIEIFSSSTETYSSPPVLKRYHVGAEADGSKHYFEWGYRPAAPPENKANRIYNERIEVVLEKDGRVCVFAGLCAVWTRMYRQERMGLYEGGEGVEGDWQYACGVSVEFEENGREHCEEWEVQVPTKIVQVQGQDFELQPAWSDVVQALRREVERQKFCLLRSEYLPRYRGKVKPSY